MVKSTQHPLRREPGRRWRLITYLDKGVAWRRKIGSSPGPRMKPGSCKTRARNRGSKRCLEFTVMLIRRPRSIAFDVSCEKRTPVEISLITGVQHPCGFPGDLRLAFGRTPGKIA